MPIGRGREQAISVCEQARTMASTLSISVSSAAYPLSANASRKPRCLRAEAATFASAYIYQPTDGLVQIDDTDLRQMDLAHARSIIVTELQESVLLTGTIRENIVLHRPGIDDEEMIRAARLSGAHKFIGRIANGYDLRLADRGESLSGGQRQSISIARAMAGRPRMLVFDEPTSAMDQESEAGLIDRLAVEIEGRTLLLITHRMSLLRLVNRVILMRDGKILADGPCDEILRRTQPAMAA